VEMTVPLKKSKKELHVHNNKLRMNEQWSYIRIYLNKWNMAIQINSSLDS
jgi:hypothetical protein